MVQVAFDDQHYHELMGLDNSYAEILIFCIQNNL